MDKASDFESEDCEFESRRGRSFFSGKHHGEEILVLELNIDLQQMHCSNTTINL